MGHYRSSNTDNFYSHSQEIQRDFDWCFFFYLTRHSYIAKLKITSSWESYNWSKEYCKLHLLVIYYLAPRGNLRHDSLCFSSDGNNHYTSLLYQVQTMLIYYLKDNPPHIIKDKFTSLTVVGDSKKTSRTIWKKICVPISMILVLVLNELMLRVMAFAERLKLHVSKRNLQRSLNNEILC